MNRIARWMSVAWRYGWPGPYTVLGFWLILAPWSGQRRWFAYRGTIGIVGPGVQRLLALAPIRGGAAALTLGHTILAISESAFHETWEHEMVHVRQYERWGVLFVPAYLLSGCWQWLHGRDAYWDNPFEIEARSQPEA
ncbi:MAG: hypothetical protein ACK6DC_23955 [Planctomycetota bacterium]|jgi:hypothetical protein